jgi:3-hydroxyacyl-[acyl-carrier-protein] dehydratase
MIDIRGILDVLPHRYPLLLVDRILEMDGTRVLGLKNVTYNEPHFLGHFPGVPVMPGVLIVEAMAQTAAVMTLADIPDRHEKLIYFTGIDNCRFRRPVIPGDQLLLEVVVVKKRARFALLHGIARVGDEVAAEADLSCAMVDRPKEGA